MTFTDYFSASYTEARQRFLTLAGELGATLLSYPIEAAGDEYLAIDVAILGDDGSPTLMTSSALHGVEGFLGSAVQLALLTRLKQQGVSPGMRYVFIHAVNPFGFAHIRRTNEDNIDVNRNFILAIEDYCGAPHAYRLLNKFLNPTSPPSTLEPYRLKAAFLIWRYGYLAVKQAIAGGQYSYPRGLFFGGRGPCQSYRIIRKHCDDWVGSSNDLVHIDFHTGLGEFTEHHLLIQPKPDDEAYVWYAERFDEERLEPMTPLAETAYKISGMFCEWISHRYRERNFRFLGAEFGTYDGVRVLGALRAENRAYYYSKPNLPEFTAAKAELLECFCPADPSWREVTVRDAMGIIEQAVKSLQQDDAPPEHRDHAASA